MVKRALPDWWVGEDEYIIIADIMQNMTMMQIPTFAKEFKL